MVVEVAAKDKALSCLGFDMTGKRWLLLACLCSVSLTAGMCNSLQGPIYPPEAEKKGATATEYGMVFAVFELVAFITCPIYGKYMDKLGCKNLLVFGMMIGGISTMLFGLLDLVETHLQFMSLSFLFRILESLGSSAAFTAAFSITAIVFSSNVATIYAIMECFFGLGFSIGPTIGGYLYQVGGFITPFMLIGGILFVDGVFLFFAVPSIKREENQDKPKVGIWSVLRLASASLDYLSIIVSNLCIGFNMATLEPHLRQFGQSSSVSGLIFAILAIFYMLSSPIVGRLCDTSVKPKAFILAGCVLTILGFALVGPLPFLDIEPSLYLVIPGLAITGMGVSCLMVPGFIDAIKSAVNGGLPDDISTYSVVSGISTSSVYLGAFVGPLVAGVLYDAVGYRWSTLFAIVIVTILLVGMSSYVCVNGLSPMKPEDKPVDETPGEITADDNTVEVIDESQAPR